MIKKYNIFTRCIVNLFVGSHVLLPLTVSAQDSFNPMRRWDVNVNRSIIGELSLPEEVQNALPELSEDGIKSGTAQLNYLNNDTTLIIDQETANLLAYWNSFNISEGNSVQYNQNPNAVALNIIQQQSPSQILGSLQCDAACWLINPNGIIFGANAEVDTRGLIAAAMEFNGLPSDAEFSAMTQEERQAFSANFQNRNFFYQDDIGTAMLVNAKALADGWGDGLQSLPRVIVKNGAVVKSEGAPVLMAGPEVINEGDISSENGQVVLAGSRGDVYVALSPTADGTPGDNGDNNYRGYLVEVDSGTGTERGGVANLGKLSADFGNVTLVASEILQAGKIKSTTAVDVNGSVRLIARDRAQQWDVVDGSQESINNAFYFDTDGNVSNSGLPATNGGDDGDFVVGTEAGKVTLAANSSIEVAIDRSIDSSGRERTIAQGDGGFTQPRSQINIEGRDIVMESGSSIVAPSAEVSIRTRENPIARLNDTEVGSDASFEMQAGAVIDVSGTEDTVLSAERNTVKIFVTSNDVKDVPEQKGGVLLREEVYIDIRKGSDVLPGWEAALNQVEKTANERSASGGSISILAKGNASIGDGATLDVSGGKVTYEEGIINTTLLTTTRGTVNIGDANPLDTITGIVGNPTTVIDPKWGEVSTYRPGPASTQRNFRQEYFEGAAAGLINIDGPLQLSDSASLLATTSLGLFQQETGQSLGADNASAGLVTIANSSGNFLQGINIVDEATTVANQLNSGELEITKTIIENSGANNFHIDAAGSSLTLEEGVNLNLFSGTALNFSARQLTISGDIRTVGSDVTLTQNSVDETDTDTLLLAGVIDTSGNWTNFLRGNNSNPALIDAGDITLTARNNLVLIESAELIANAGAKLSTESELAIGKAGDITLAAESNNNLDPSQLLIEDPMSISALDADEGGRLTIKTDGNITLGDFGSSVLLSELEIDNSFFDQNVGAYRFVANNGNINLQSDADIDLSHPSLIAIDSNVSQIRSTDNTDQVLVAAQLPDYLAASGSLMLDALRLDPQDTTAGTVVMAEGANITGPAESGVDFLANNRLLINGDITIDGGQVNAALTRVDRLDLAGGENNYILFGDAADINLNAHVIDIPTAGLLEDKRLVSAGKLNINALYGYALVDQGADINLLGEVAVFNQRLFSDNNSAGTITRSEVPITAGEFSVIAERGFDIAARINFGDTGAAYQGGTQSYRLSKSNSLDDPRLNLVRINGQSINNPDVDSGVQMDTAFPDLSIVLTDNSIASHTSNLQFDAAGTEVLESQYVGQGRINSDNLQNNHNARISLDTDNFNQGVNQSSSQLLVENSLDIAADSRITINTPNLVLSGEQTEFGVNAPIVELGEVSSQQTSTPSLNPATGSGQLLVDSSLLSLTGNISISGVEQINIRATQGVNAQAILASGAQKDIDRSELKTAADISIITPLLWGGSLANYTFDLRGADSTFELNHLNQTTLAPISAGASLTVKADNIVVDSKIAAPFGSIVLEADDTVNLGHRGQLSVAGESDVPLGRIVADVGWLYPTADNNANSVNTYLNDKRIKIDAPTIETAEGSEVNLSGGGSIYGREFVSGLGGSFDILAGQHYTQAFAIIPTHQSGLAPYDIIEFAGSGIEAGTVVDIRGSQHIADGRYTVLPANYALLPGALLVTPEATAVTIDEGYRGENRFGAEIVSGRFNQLGNTANNTWGGFRIEPGSVVNQRAEYRITQADKASVNLFNEQPGVRPEDNGRLVLSATENLNWNTQLLSSDHSPIGTSFDLTSTGDIVVGNITTDSALVVDPNLFNAVNADSILIGGERQWSSEQGAWQMSPLANNVTIDGANVAGDELLITARDSVTLLNNSQVETSNTNGSFKGNRWAIDNDGVTLLSSNTNGSQLLLDEVSRLDGRLLIETGSAIIASGALGLAYDGSSSLANLSFTGDNEKRLSVASGNGLSVGSTEAGAQIGSQLFEAAQITELQSNASLSFTESTSANVSSLLIQADGIRLNDGTTVGITASESISLIAGNTDAASSNTVATGSVLELTAPQLLLSNSALKSAGNQAAGSNFSSDNYLVPYIFSSNAETTNLTGTNTMTVLGTVEISTGGDLTLETTQLNTNGIGELTTRSEGVLNLLSTSRTDVSAGVHTHGIFNFIATDNITVDTAISARSGLITIESSNGMVEVGSNARLDVSPYTVQLQDKIKSGKAGTIAIHSSSDLIVSDPRAFIFGFEQQSGEGGVLELLSGAELVLGGGAYDGSVGQWSTGGVDLKLQAESLRNGMQNLLILNQQGFNGDLDVVLTGTEQNLVLNNNERLDVANLRLASLQSSTLIAGDINVNGATKNVVIHGGEGVSIDETANINISSTDKIVTSIESPDNGVTIAESAVLNIDSDLNIVSGLSALQTTPVSTSVVLNSDDTINGEVNLVVNDTFLQTNVTQNILTSAATTLLSGIDGLTLSDFIQSNNDVGILAQLDIVSAGNLNVQALDLTGGAFYNDNDTSIEEDDIPGILRLRAAGDITITGGINAATNEIVAFSQPINASYDGSTQVLLSKDSWSVNLASGNDSQSHYLFNDFRRSQTSGDVNLSSNSFIKTGAGDIELYALNLNIDEGAYIAALGKAEYSPINPSLPFLPSEAPSWGTRNYAELYQNLADFSGFSRETGDINIVLSGNLVSLDNDISGQNPSSFIQRVSNDGATPNVDYAGIRTWALAADKIQGGIHSVAGGDINITVAGDVRNTFFSTPSLGLDYSVEAEGEALRVDEILGGGELQVSSRGDITRSGFANDNSVIDVRALGAIKGDGSGDGESIVIGSNTDITIEAGTGLRFNSILNTFSLPQSNLQGSFGNNNTAALYIDGFDNSSARMSTVNGDLVRNSTTDALLAFLGRDINSNLPFESGNNDGRLSLLPGQVSLSSLGGDVVLAEEGSNQEINLFPSAEGSLELFSAGDILRKDSGDPIVKFYRILDIDPQLISGLNLSNTSASDALFKEALSGSLTVTGLFNAENNGRNGLTRVNPKTTEIYAANNIGLEGVLTQFDSPVSLITYAGQDILDTSFDIQHANRSDISQITAGNDIRYSLSLSSNGELVNRNNNGITIAGPGDAIISAQGTINLAATGGIRSTRNISQPSLPGANIHVLSGFNQVGDYKRLVGTGINDGNQSIHGLTNLPLDDIELDSLSFIAWFHEQASIASDELTTNAMIDNISRATGSTYTNLNSALEDWSSLSQTLQTRIAVGSMKEIALSNPAFLVNKGEILFANPVLGEAGFSSPEERQQTFNQYWNTIGSLIALDYLLTPDREADLLTGLSSGSDITALSGQSIAQQLNTAVSVFDQTDRTKQFLIAEQIMLAHTRQAGIEGGKANSLIHFERGYVAQRQFFGSDSDLAIAGLIERGATTEREFGARDGVVYSNINQILQAWSTSSSTDFSIDSAISQQLNSKDIEVVFSAIRSTAGGDVNVMAPNGSVNVGLAAAQLEALGVDKASAEQGILALGLGDVNGIVANQFNVNESRTFSLAGGAVNLWSSFGNIDAGRGAKTAFSLPESRFVINDQSGAITLIRPPAVSGSGIRTSESRSLTTETLTNERRFYEVAAGAGATFLATPVGVVDAGEAGIASAGDLFIAAAEVRGADNINVGGVSVGVATDTSVGVGVASAGNASNAATDSLQSAIADAASGKESNESDLSAFITIELIETGI